ncbi:MAG: DUF4279 domain-containing protein [bacterium]
MINTKSLIQIAVDEVIQQNFRTTQQYLKVHSLVKTNEIPQISRIDTDKNDGTVIVYFSLVNYDYYLSVWINTTPKLEIRSVSIEAGNQVYLSVTSEGATLQEILNTTTIKPTKKWNNGDTIVGKRKYRTSGIIFEPFPEKADELEDKVEKLIKELYPHKNELTKLSEISELCIKIKYLGYKNEMWGWHINNETLTKISELSSSIDFDIYAKGPDLQE